MKDGLDRLEEKMREEVSLSRKTGLLLKYIGVPQGIQGYDYIKEAVILGLSDHGYLRNIVGGLYEELAKKFDTTRSRVERSIRHAVECCMVGSNNNDELVYVFGKNALEPNNKMINSTFISSLVHFIEELN